MDRSRAKTRRRRVTDAGRSQRRLWPAVIALEGRALLATFTVNSTADDGSTGTLRWAVAQANANTNPAGSVINFDPVLFSTPQTITLTSTLTLSDTAGPEVIVGPGASLGTVSGN